jgi:hypothetical protein
VTTSTVITTLTASCRGAQYFTGAAMAAPVKSIMSDAHFLIGDNFSLFSAHQHIRTYMEVMC